MYCSITRWSRTVTAAAFLTLPLAASAQPPPAEQKPAAAQPPATQQPAAQQPATQQPATQQPATQQADSAAAKQHLGDARATLSQLTALPEAARLQGESRTQVSQLITNFNELITTQSDWRAAYAKVDANLSSLLGPETPADAAPPASGVSGAVGTSGATAATIDPAVRTKLLEFRMHLKKFEGAAGGATAGAMAPAVATGSADPAIAPAAAGATSAPGVTPDSPTATMPPADQAKAAEQVGHSEADKHLDAISAILDQSKTGTLTKAQTAELKKHVAELRVLLKQSK